MRVHLYLNLLGLCVTQCLEALTVRTKRFLKVDRCWVTYMLAAVNVRKWSTPRIWPNRFPAELRARNTICTRARMAEHLASGRGTKTRLPACRTHDNVSNNYSVDVRFFCFSFLFPLLLPRHFRIEEARKTGVQVRIACRCAKRTNTGPRT